jgi:hypothetical protein
MKKIIAVFAVACLATSCSNNAEQASVAAAQRAVDSMKTEMVKKQTIDSMNAAASQAVTLSNEQPVVVSSHTPAHGHAAAHNSYSSNTTTNNYNTAPVAAAPEPAKKKGWSAKAKGAVIGTGVGAITGAMVDKKKGEGAVVGGLIGAAAGLGAGAIIDKKK